MYDVKFTKREMIVSVAIVAILLVIGLGASWKISERIDDKNAEYNSAIKIDSPELFQYGMATNAGNAFVQGKLSAVNPLIVSELEGEYAQLKKVTEKYTMHTTTSTTSVNGHIRTNVRTYWTWDEVDSSEIFCDKIVFCDTEFSGDKILLDKQEVGTVKDEKRGDIRYVYYGASAELDGTLYARLSDNTISDVDFFENETIDSVGQVVLNNKSSLVAFWTAYIIFMIAAVFLFAYMDNKWLE